MVSAKVLKWKMPEIDNSCVIDSFSRRIIILFLVTIIPHLLCPACELSVITGKCVYIQINRACIRLDTIHGIRHLLSILKYIPP